MDTNTASSSLRKSFLALFFFVVGFNIFLQFDTAEIVFDSLFANQEASSQVANASPICGTTSQIDNNASHQRFWATHAGAAAVSFSGAKTGSAYLPTLSLLYISAHKKSLSDFQSEPYKNSDLTLHSGLSPPLT